jgi:hypothetical protein
MDAGQDAGVRRGTEGVRRVQKYSRLASYKWWAWPTCKLWMSVCALKYSEALCKFDNTGLNAAVQWLGNGTTFGSGLAEH